MLLSVTLGRPHPEPGRKDSGILKPVQKSSREGCVTDKDMDGDGHSNEGKVHRNASTLY